MDSVSASRFCPGQKVMIPNEAAKLSPKVLDQLHLDIRLGQSLKNAAKYRAVRLVVRALLMHAAD